MNAAYVHKPDDGDLVTANVQLPDTTLRALKEVAPNFRHFIWQTGAKVSKASQSAFVRLTDRGFVVLRCRALALASGLDPAYSMGRKRAPPSRATVLQDILLQAA